MPVVLSRARIEAGALAAFVATVLLAAPVAWSATWTVSCTNGTIKRNNTTVIGASAGDTASNILGLLLGTPGVPPSPPTVPASGDTIVIAGTCTEDVTITTPQLTLVNSSNPTETGNDSIVGQLEVAGVGGIVLQGLILGSTSAAVTFSSMTDQALLYVHDGANVTIEFSIIQNSSLFGVLAAQSSTVSLLSTTVTTNGSVSAPQTTSGIRAVNGSSVILAAAPNSGGQASFVQSSHGDALDILSNSTLLATDGTMINNNASGRQILLQSGSSAHISGGLVDGSLCEISVCFDAIDLVGGSSLIIDAGSGGGATVIGALGASTIFASQGSGVVTSNAAIDGNGGAPVLDAGDNSVIALAGGNTICSVACSTSTTGTAIQIDHVSALVQVAPALYGYPAATAAEQIFGNGTVQLQSTVDLGGLGTVASGPSLVWTTASSTSPISVSQNSSLRLQGSVQINGKLDLTQGSNGFFNIATGNGANSVTGNVSCPFTAIPASHVSASGGALTPAPTLSSNFLNPGSGVCLDF